MAQKVLIMGESGTGKSTSMRNCDPATTAVVNPVGKPLPFKGSGKFAMLNGETEARKICKWMKEQAAAGKKLIVVDDFQYILAVPYMNRIKETGWDKYNDFGANYFEIIEVCKELPDDVIVAYMTHLETLENGLTTVKLIGKLLREKITIEGLFSIVLRTGVNEAKYYFYTQNSGKDTVKSPIGMFPAYAIDNDLNYVADKIRNYYEIGEFKSDAEMGQADAEVAADIAKPESGRRGRKTKAETAAPPQAAPEADTPKSSGRRGRKTHDEVVEENNQKMADYMEKCEEAVDKIADGREEVPFDEAVAATDEIPKPELETPPRRTRKERKTALTEDTYFYIEADDNYVMKHAGDAAPDGGKVITKEEFVEGCKHISQESAKKEDNPLDGTMNPPESGRRTRRTKTEEADAEPSTPAEPESTGTRTRRTRRTR